MAGFKIELIGESQLQIVEEIHPIVIGKPLEFSTPKGSYVFKSISFLDHKSKTASAGLFEISPGTATRTDLITEGVRCQDVILEGEGCVLMLRPADALNSQPYFDFYRLNAGSVSKYVIEYGKGSLLSYIAGRKGMRMLGLYHPPFTDDMELTTEKEGQEVLGGLTIPPTYWKTQIKIIEYYKS